MTSTELPTPKDKNWSFFLDRFAALAKAAFYIIVCCGQPHHPTIDRFFIQRNQLQGESISQLFGFAWHLLGIAAAEL
jgi:hypothetical protein